MLLLNPSELRARPPAAAWHATPASRAFLLGLGGGVALLCLLLRIPALAVSLWIDEAGSLAQASAAEFWRAARQDVHPPLYYLLLRGELSFTASIPLLRLPSVLAGLGLALGAAWCCRFSRVAAIAAGVLFAAAPELVLHSVQLRPYGLLLPLLGLALLLGIQRAREPGGAGAQVALSLVLLAAAATHLATLLFIVSLVPLLAWPARHAGLKALAASLWPLAPALLLTVWLKFGFLTQPNDLPEGWWVAPASFSDTRQAFADATGWSNLQWLAETVARKSPLPAWSVTSAGAICVILGLSAAFRPQTDRVSGLLLTSALVYWTALLVYSLLFEPIILARTVAPGLLPLFAWVAWGLGHQTRRLARVGGVIAITGYTAMAVIMPMRLVQLAPPGLRGMADTLRAGWQPGDLIVSLRGVETGIGIYWTELPRQRLLALNLARPLPAQMKILEQELAAMPPAARVWFVYREDRYVQRDRALLEIISHRFGQLQRPLTQWWQSGDLRVLRTQPPAPAPR